MDNRTNLRMRFLDRGEQSWHQPAAGGANAAKSCFACYFGISGVDVGFNVLQFMDDSSGALNHQNAIFGKFAALSIDQTCTKLFFEARDVCRDVALYGAERSRSGGKRAVFRNGNEAFQMANFHKKRLTIRRDDYHEK